MSSDEESVHSIVEEVENELELGHEDDNLEVIEEQPTEEANGSQNAEDEAEEEKARKVVKPKRVVKNPQPKLNEQTLRGPRGLSAIEGYFQRVKFKGKGHEEHDLNVLMKTYEYWCHRLFPKFPYDNCIARLETLGTKKGTQTLLKLIRMDMATEQEIVSDNEENDDLQEPTEHTENAFDQLLPSSSGAPGHNTSETQELPEDIQERIRQNKERAERIRLERLQRARDQAAISLPGSNRLSSSQHHNEDVNEDLFGNQTDDQKEEETIEDLLDEINSQKASTEKPEKNKSSVIYSDEEIDQDEVIKKNKSPSTNKKASAKLSELESSEDEASEPEKGQKHSNGGLVNGINEQEFEVKTKKRKVKVIDSDSDSEKNSQVTQSKMMSDDEDVDSAVEEHNRQGLDEEKAKKRGRVIDSDNEKQTEGTIDELLNEINTTETLDRENGQDIESDEDIEGDSTRENKHYRKKLRTIESDEDESEPFPNNASDFKEKKAADSQHNKCITSDSEESDNENNINKVNVFKRTQDVDQTSNYVPEHIQDTNPNSQSMSQNEDRKNDHNGHADISNETDD